MAEESAGIQTLLWLGRGPHEVVAVVAAAPSPDHQAASVAVVAQRAGLEVRDPRLVRSPCFANELRKARVDLLLNVHSLVVAHEAVVEAPIIGSYNLHPGPLPRFAGLNAPSWAIYEGEREHAVTVHRMTSGIDTGAIAFRHLFEISPTETGLSLSLKCTRFGVPLLQQIVEAAARDPASIPAEPQDSSQRRYFGREVPYAGTMQWDTPARSLERFVRAADYGPFPSPWGRPRMTLEGRQIGVAATMLTGEDCSGASAGALSWSPDGSLRVATADEWLVVRRVEIDGVVSEAAEALAKRTG